MARRAAQANQVADAVMTLIAAIDSTADANKWLTKPLTKRRELLVDALTIDAKPALAVEVGQYQDVRKGAGLHEPQIRIDVHLIVQGGEGAETTLNSLAADVMFAISQDETLGGLVGDWPEAFSYTPQTEIMLARGGLGVATVSFSVTPLPWDHTTANPS